MIFQKLYLNRCPSTNDFLQDEIYRDQAFAVYTFHQTKGKGQRGNKWEAEQGQNVAISFNIPKKRLNLNQIQINMMATNVTRHFIQSFLKEKVFIKWPNDIIAMDKKLSGILIEENSHAYIIGIGINVNQTRFEGLPKAISMAQLSGENYDLKSFANQMVSAMQEIFPVHDSEILPLYNHYLYKKGEWQNFQINDQVRNAKILAVDEVGKMVLQFEKEEKQHSFLHGQAIWNW